MFFKGHSAWEVSTEKKGQEGKLHLPWSKQEIRDLDQCGDKEADKVKTSGR